MGRPFLEHLGGRQIFACERCDTYLSNSKEVLSRTFRGATGTAYLFRNVVNILLVGKESRQMITGNHVVRDVHCKNCRCKIGWMYEFAHDPTQMYKEGHVILERQLLRESEEANVRLAERVQRGMRRSESASSMSSSGVSSVTVT